MPRRIARSLPPEHPEFEPLGDDADLFASGGYSCAAPGADSYKGFSSHQAPRSPSGDSGRTDLTRLYMVGGIVAAVVATIGVGWLTTKPETSAAAKTAAATLAAPPTAAPPTAAQIKEARLTPRQTPASTRARAIRPRAMRATQVARPSEAVVLKLARPAGSVTPVLGSDAAAKFTITHPEESAGPANPSPPADSKSPAEATPPTAD